MNPKLTIKDMQALRDLLTVLEDGPLRLEDLATALTSRGHKTGRKVEQWLEKIEGKLGSKSKLLLDTETTGPSSLSTAGRRICHSFTKVLEEIETGVDPEITDRRLRVKIGLTNGLTSNLLPRVLTDAKFFSAPDFANVDLKVVEGESHELERHVQTGWVDFAIAPGEPPRKTNLCDFEELCLLKRVLIFNPKTQVTWKDDFHKWADSGCDSKERLQRCLAEQTVLIPPRNVMHEVEGLLLPPKTGKGRYVKIPQAAQRRSWVRQGLGVAFAHEDRFAEETIAGNVLREIDLSSPKLLGTTKLCLYLPKSKKSPLSVPATKLIESIKVFTKQSADVSNDADPNVSLKVETQDV